MPRIKFLVFNCLIFLSLISFAQQKKSIVLEDIWVKGTFRGQYMQGFNWMSDEKSYTDIEGNRIVKFDAESCKAISTIFPNKQNIAIDEYEFNSEENKILIAAEKESIYRHSYVAYYYIYDINTQKLDKLFSEKISYPTFSPDGQKIAFVSNNNLYYVNLSDLKSVAVTKDGKKNFIINGSTDWVYEEEFSFTKAFSWSPDSKKIAYYTFDETEVREYNLQLWNDLYPSDYQYKYPKAGEKNSTVNIHCFFLDSAKKKTINIGNEKDIYIPRMQWSNHNDIVSIQKLNRHQNNFEILHANISTDDVKVVYKESNNTYVEITDDLTYLKDGNSFVLTSEKDGFRHLYQYDMTGKLINQITKGSWELGKFLGIDEKIKLAYYTSTEESPLERHFYSIGLDGKNKRKLSQEKGTHEITASPNFKYYIDEYSTLNSPPVISLHLTSTKKKVKELINHEEMKQKMKEYEVSTATFFDFKTSDNVSINGFMIKPTNFDQSKKYPVLLTVYGGPGHQSVTDSWEGYNFFWYQMLAQQGYVIISIDNRGTGGRGADFKKVTQNQLGKLETEDLIHTAKYLSTLSFIDKSRIGIFGWSFGGYLSSLAITVGSDYYKLAIAVAPVISWRFYDTIYTERYLGLPQENASGYDDNSPLSHAKKLKGHYLLIHGTADDNVHVQNAYAMQSALINANKQFESAIYPDKNHGIYGGYTRFHLYKKMTDFILENL